MKTEFRKNEGDIVRSLLDGMHYRILSVGEETVNVVPVVEEDSDGKKTFTGTQSETVEVSRKVFDELFFVVEKAPAAVPEEGMFTIGNGRLYKNGEEIETGTLVPVEIMALIPGAVLLTVKSRTEGKYDLFHFNAEAYVPEYPDKAFQKLTNAKTEIEMVYQKESITGFLVTQTEEITLPPEKDGDDPVQAVSVWQTVRFYSGKSWLASTDEDDQNPLIGEKIFESKGDGRDVLLFATDIAVRLTDEGWTGDPENSGKRTCLSKITIDYRESDHPVVGLETVRFNGQIEKIIPCNDEDSNFIIVTKDGIVHTNYGHGKRYALGTDVLDAVEEYPIPAAIRFSGSRETTFVFAKPDYKGVCKIKVLKTENIGFVTTIEENR